MRERIGVSFLVCAFLFSPAKAPAEAEAGGERRISVDLVGIPVEDVFRSFADELGVRLYLDEGLVGSLSLRLDNVRVRTALDAACDSIGCTYVIVEGERAQLQVLRSQTDEARGRGLVTQSLVTDRTLMPVTLSLRDAKLADVMGSMARILECDLDLQVEASRAVTIELQNVTAMQALERIGGLTNTQTAIIPHRPLADDCVLRVTPGPE